jgi:Streptomyces sporulation and cell division protein, SsgA
MNSNGRTAVSAELGLGLVGPDHTIAPLMASLYYSCHEPYAVKMAFHVGTDEPVEWILARDLLAAALHSRAGVGDVQAWPSAASAEEEAGLGPKILNISMTSPFGHAQFEASAAAIEAFLARTYQLVADGQESAYMDFDAELAELLSQA